MIAATPRAWELARGQPGGPAGPHSRRLPDFSGLLRTGPHKRAEDVNTAQVERQPRSGPMGSGISPAQVAERMPASRQRQEADQCDVELGLGDDRHCAGNGLDHENLQDVLEDEHEPPLGLVDNR